MKPPVCQYCGNQSTRVTGRDLYPHRPDLAAKVLYRCAPCDAHVGAHPGTEVPLGELADGVLRGARMALHNHRLDPLWRAAPLLPCYRNYKSRGRIVQAARRRTYGFLAERMGIGIAECHIGMFNLEQCQQAWSALDGVTAQDIRDWAKAKEEEKAK